MSGKRKIGVWGLAIVLILVAVLLALAQPLSRATAGQLGSSLEPGVATAPPITAVLLATGTVLLVSALLLSRIMQLRPAEDPVRSRR